MGISLEGNLDTYLLEGLGTTLGEIYGAAVGASLGETLEATFGAALGVILEATLG